MRRLPWVSFYSYQKVKPIEKIQLFNHRFTTFLNKIPAVLKLTKDILEGFYSTTILVCIVMLVKRVGKDTRDDDFEDDHKVEKKMKRLKVMQT